MIDETIHLIVEQNYTVVYYTNSYIGRIISIELRIEPLRLNKKVYQIKCLKEDLNRLPISLQGSGPLINTY